MALQKTDCWVVIPAHNEEKHISDVVKRVKKRGFSNVIVVNDGSTDRTEQIARNAGAVVLTHVVNLHKGAAMTTGIRYALKNKAKAIIFMDGDGQHCPEELPQFLEALNEGHDIVFGYRKESRKMPFQRRLGKIITSSTVRTLYRMDLHDVLNGYRAMTASAYRKIKWTSRNYNVESEMIARAGKANLSYTEVKTKIIYHNKFKGMTALNGFHILWKLFWWKITL